MMMILLSFLWVMGLLQFVSSHSHHFGNVAFVGAHSMFRGSLFTFENAVPSVLSKWPAASSRHGEGSSSSSSSSGDVTPDLNSEPYYPPLTETELQNRKAEMILIARLLSQGDKAIAEFKLHWFSERGEETKARLMKADFDIGKGPDFWPEAESLLLELVETDPSFLEPKVRLSKLRCLQGKFQKAKELSLQVLDSKPWHFVALETMVAVSTAQGNQVLAELWTSRRLPNPSKPDLRTQWVERALQDAEVILDRMQGDTTG